jgi:hypothetical protein
LNIDIDHIGERSMRKFLTSAAAVAIAWSVTNVLWAATLVPGLS